MPTSGSSRRCTSGSRPTRRASTRPGSTTSRRTATAHRAAARATAARPQHHQRHARRLHHRDQARAASPPSPPPRPPPRPPRATAKRATPPAAHVDPTPTPAPVAKPRPESKAAEPAKGTTNPVPKEQPPAEQSAASDEPTYTVLRGAPARTAANMDASLTVPTATSVRSVPVKLLWDNRTVINNHLARARGGKVSFTHLIGYALVKALRAMPGDERRLRHRRRQAQPDHARAHQPRPRHRHAEARRHPPAAGAVDQGRRDDGLRGVLDGLRGHRAQGPRQQARPSRTSRAPRSR